MKSFSRRQLLISAALPAVPLGTVVLTGQLPSLVADKDSYPGLDPTGVLNSQPALQKAIDDTPAGGLLEVAAGTYLIDGMLSNKGKAIAIEGYGVTLTKARDTTLLSMYRSFEKRYNVVSATPIQLATPDAGVIDALDVQLNENFSWSRGDIVKIISDDTIQGARPGSVATEASRNGQFMTVESQSGNKATLRGKLRGIFSTNPRIARMAKGRVCIRGLTLQTSAGGMSAAWKTGMCVFNSVHMPVVEDVTVLSSPTAAINFKSCYSYSVRNVSVLYATDSPNTAQYGYGIIDNSSAFGSIESLHAASVRHAYTDDTARIPAGSTDLAAYGMTHGTRISDSSCVNATTAAFDTHLSSEEVVFANCSAENSPVGFSLRGRRHTVQGCTTLNCSIALRIMTEETGGESWGHRITDLHAEDTKLQVVQAHVHHPGHPRQNQLETRPNFIQNLTSNGSSADVLYCRNTRLEVSQVTAHLRSALPDGARIFHVNNGQIVADNVRVDFAENTTGANIDIWSVAGSPQALVDVQYGRLSLNEQQVARLRHYSVLSDNAAVYHRHAVLDRKSPVLTNRLSPGSFLNWTLADNSGSSGAIVSNFWDIAGPGLVREISETSIAALQVFCDPGDNDRIIAPFFPAWFFGQIMTIINIGTVKRVRIRHGAEFNTSLVGNVERILGPGQVIRLAAAPGKVWREI